MQLNNTEKKILNFINNHIGKRPSINEIAAGVGCKPETVMRKLQDEDFRALFMEALTGTLAARTPEVLNSLVDTALLGSTKAQKMFLEIVGLYRETKEVRGKVEFAESQENPFKTEEQRKNFVKVTLSKVAAEVSTEEDADA